MTQTAAGRERRAQSAHTEGHYLPTYNADDAGEDRPVDWVDHRASLANVFRRVDRGETPATCEMCGAEVDVESVVAHAPTCAFYGLAPEVVEENDAPAPVEFVSAAGPLATSPEYQASAERAGERSAADDFDLEICGWCGCEVDVDVPAHRPGCSGIGKPRVSSDRVLAVLSEREPKGREEAAAADPSPADGHDVPTSAVAVVGVSRGQDDSPEPASRSENTARRSSRRPRKWTRETIRAAFARWFELHGGPPRSSDWLKPTDGEWPQVSAVVRDYGSWNAAMEACGFAPRGRGGSRTSGGARVRESLPDTPPEGDTPAEEVGDARVVDEREERAASEAVAVPVADDEAARVLDASTSAIVAELLRRIARGVDASLFRGVNLAEILDSVALEVRGRLDSSR